VRIHAAFTDLLDRTAGAVVMRDVTLLELFCGCASFMWGFWVFFPGTFANTPTTIAMWETMPEWAWAIIFMAGGLFQAINSTTTRFKARRFAAFWGVVSWLFLETFRVTVDPQTSATLMDAAFVFAEALVFIRLPQHDRRGAQGAAAGPGY
jgi:hypothetical protein